MSIRHRAPHRPLRRRLLIGAGTFAAVAVPCAIALAYWSTSGAGAASATTLTMNAPTSVTASATAGSASAHVSWTASATSSSAVTPTGYYVTRTSGVTTSAACGSSASSLVNATSCDDTQVPNGTYTYTVVAVFHSWTATSAASNSVKTTNIVPSETVNQASSQADPVNAGPIVFTAVFNEPVTGFSSSSVTVGGTAPGTKSVSISGSGTTYTISVSGMTGSGTVTAAIPAGAVQDSNGTPNVASTSTDNSVLYDVTAPTAPALLASAAVTSGSNPVYVPSTAVTFTDAATDADSGVRSVAYYRCAGSGGCSATTGTQIGSSSTGSTYSVQSSVPFAPSDGTYSVVAVVTDKAGNVSTSASLLIALDSAAPSASAPVVNGNS